MTDTPCSDILDCLVIGGGPAGLTAAMYLARYLRRVQIVDGGDSRLKWIPKSHNYPGVPEGMNGRDALQHMRNQVALYRIPVVEDMVVELQRETDGGFLAICKSGRRILARTVLLCTGVQDVQPEFEGARQALADSVLRYCPICDGFEAIDKKTVVLGISKGGLTEALFVRHYTPYLSLLTMGKTIDLDPQESAKLRAAQIRVFDAAVTDIRYKQSDRTIVVRFDDGNVESFDVMYSALGTNVNAGQAEQVGITLNADGKVEVDAHMRTTVPDFYAAGDIVAGVNQIAVAIGQAAIAATAIHNSLNTWHN